MLISYWSSDVCSSHLREHILDEYVHRRLGYGQEIFRDIILADGFAHIAGGEIDRALPAFLHLLCSRERGAVEREGLLCDRIGQYVRETIETAHDQQIGRAHV